MRRWRYAYNTNGLAHHRLSDAVDLLADLGYEAISLTPDVGHLDPLRAGPRDVEEFAAHLRRRNLGVSVQTGARFVLDPRRKHQPNLLDPDGSERRRRFDLLVRCLDIARDLGATVLSFWSGTALAGLAPGDERRASSASRPDASPCSGPDVPGAGPGAPGEPGVPAAPGWESASDLDARFTDACRRLCDAAADRGLVVALEPEPGMWIATVADWDRIEREVAHPAFRLALDVGHVHCNREGDPAAFVRGRAGRLADVQVEDMRAGEHVHLAFGEGDLDVGPALRALADVGYSDLVVVELSRDSHRAADVAAAAIAHLRRICP